MTQYLYHIILQERKWVKLTNITHTIDSSSHGTSLLRLTGSYTASRMSRAVVTTFAVIILTIDFGQDEDSKGKSGIDYLLTTGLYFLISELKFSKSEEHALVR